MKSGARVTERVYVWDRLVRSTHWLLAVLVLSTFFLLEGGDAPHEWAGYAAMLVVGIRMLWAVVGRGHARLSSFFPTPTRLRGYVASYRRDGCRPSIGHNPVGACMVLTMLTLVSALALTGWLMGTDTFWGDEWLQQTHTASGYLLIGCASLHVFTVVLISRLTRVNLPKAMVTGYKERTAASRPFQSNSGGYPMPSKVPGGYPGVSAFGGGTLANRLKGRLG